MTELPLKLREALVHKTHGGVIQSIKFFQDKNNDFNSAIVFELQPINCEYNELLYMQGDQPTQIFFISEGSFRLYADLKDYINDEEKFA
jgi:CRP-like cAMP-binding protein